MKAKQVTGAVFNMIFRLVLSIIIILVVYRLAMYSYHLGYMVFADVAKEAEPGRDITIAVDTEDSTMDVAKTLDMSQYELAIRETKTAEVIMDVSTMKSEIGVLYLSDFNRKSMEKLLNSANLEFHPLIECDAYVYLWKEHPLAEEACITMKQLENYPCLAFEQGDNSSFYLSEELLPTNEYSQIIHANDRATMLNLMVGLNGYTLCSGLICEDLNGNDYRAVPFKNSEGPEENKMEVGYVTRKNLILSKLGEMYVNALKEYLKTE